MDDDFTEMQASSAPTIYGKRASAGGAISAAAAAAADIVAPTRNIQEGPGGPAMADGKGLVDARISNNHKSPC